MTSLHTREPLRLQRSPVTQFDFADIAWLFHCCKQNRGIARLNFDEAALLWRTARETGGTILEIGRYQAGSTVLLAASAAGRRVVSIDIDPQHHAVADQFLQRPDIAPHLELLVADSRQPLKGREFGMLYIDGDHSYEGVRADVQAHWNELQPTNGRPALAAFHDVVPRIGHSETGHSASTEFEADELTEQVDALRQMLIDAFNAGSFNSTLRSLIAGHRENVVAAKLLLDFGQLPDLKAQSEPSTPETNGPNRLCRELQSSGAASHHARAGSMLVLRKTAELG